MKITAIEPFILHVPLNVNSISDSTNTITYWSLVGTKIVVDTGLEGYGFTGNRGGKIDVGMLQAVKMN